MKVLFSNPPWWEADAETRRFRGGLRAGARRPGMFPTVSAPDRFAFGDPLPYPFLLGYATTYVARHTGAKTRLRDSLALRESYKSYLEFLLREQPDYIFIESAPVAWDHDAKVIASIHHHLPQAKLCLCGPITSLKAREILATLPVTACIQGEYEKGCVKVVQGATGLLGPDELSTAEMNDAPFPYYDETIARRYCQPYPAGQLLPHAMVWSGRDSPAQTGFREEPAPSALGAPPPGPHCRAVRPYSSEHLDAFLRDLLARFQFQAICFDDAPFNLSDAQMDRVCTVMARLRLPWSACCRTDLISPDRWRQMRDAGCFGVKLCFEDGNQRQGDCIFPASPNLEQARETVWKLKSLGLTVHGSFTHSRPGETDLQWEDTRRYITSLPFDSIQLFAAANAVPKKPEHLVRAPRPPPPAIIAELELMPVAV